MKRKLRIDDLAVTSFPTDGDGLARPRGTVRGASGETQCYESWVIPESCDYPCGEVGTRDTCYHTCHATCDDLSCQPTCLRAAC